MKITEINLTENRLGIAPFSFSDLGDIILLTGGNGAGKTRMLNMIRNHLSLLRNHQDAGETALQIVLEGNRLLDANTASQVRIIDYSHYDAKLQSPKDYSPYVIHRAKDVLQDCNYEKTALNSLLLIEDLAHGFSEEFRDGSSFQNFCELAREFHLDIQYNKRDKKLTICNSDCEAMALSPGQVYLLRMIVACFQNKDRDDLIFFLDEPELHLHPSALIEMLKKLRAKFTKAQFWISTHALSLISYYTITEQHATTLYLEDGKVKRLRSDSSGLLEGLIGNEDNLFAIQQLFSLPDQYACNRFTFECFFEPTTLPAQHNGKADPEAKIIDEADLTEKRIVDYGAGQGRFLEEWAFCRELRGETLCAPYYYAYDPFPTDAGKCKAVMNRYSAPEEHYSNDIVSLQNELSGQVDYVLMVNVLHEIKIEEWCAAFKDIRKLLREDGSLLIVERDVLSVGETVNNVGYMMLTPAAAQILFGPLDDEQIKRDPKKKEIVKYTVKRDALAVDEGKVRRCIERIHQDALLEIAKINEEPLPEERHNQYKQGAKKAFLLNQYANASLWLQKQKKKGESMLKAEGKKL